jgi:hypothetical protein
MADAASSQGEKREIRGHALIKEKMGRVNAAASVCKKPS